MEQQEQDAQGPAIGPIAKPLGRAIGRFDDDPTSARLAMFVIVVAVITTVVVGGVLMWLVDRQRIPGPGGRVLVRPPDRHDRRLRRRHTQRTRSVGSWAA